MLVLSVGHLFFFSFLDGGGGDRKMLPRASHLMERPQFHKLSTSALLLDLQKRAERMMGTRGPTLTFCPEDPSLETSYVRDGD